MYLSLNFIKQYVKLPDASPKDLALALTMSTVEVEDVIDQEKKLEGIVVGKLIDVVKHPQADRLWVCRVDIKSEILQIICGGNNLKKDMLVAVAKVGSKVRWHGEGDRITLEKAKIRGIESNGMIAASDELGLQRLFPGGEREILDLSPYQVRVGDPLAKALGLNDFLLEIDNKSMTHRPDLWGEYGLAREYAAIYSSPLKPLKINPIPSPAKGQLPLTVSVKDTALCLRYMALVIDNVSDRPSPWWLKRDLDALGFQSINALVDITNYITAVLGQPMHAFDYAKLAGSSIVVERAGVGKKFKALNGKEYELPSDALMIKDAKKPVAVAGVIGGEYSAISESTKTVVLEVATFEASSVRRTSTALALRTESSARFEKKLDPILAPQALAMAADLILQVMPEAVVASKVFDVYGGDEPQRTIQVSKEFLDHRLGIVLDAKEIVNILKRLSFGAAYKKDLFSITVPSFRSKGVAAREDIVEEVARIYGYNNIKPSLPIVEIAKPQKGSSSRVERECKMILSKGLGYTEVYSYSFADPKWTERLELNRGRITVKNAIAQELSFLRTSLLPNLIGTAASNIRWRDAFKLFEVGRIFNKSVGEHAIDGSSGAFLPNQPIMVSGIAVAKKNNLEKLYRELKGDINDMCKQCGISLAWKESVKHPFGDATFELRSNAKTVGVFGVLKEEIAGSEFEGYCLVFWELQFEFLVKHASFSRSYQPLLKFPSISRDIAIIVDTSVSWGAVEQVVQHLSPLITDVSLFDIFTSPKLGAGKKSIAFSLTFGSEERTLESYEVDQVINKLTKILKEKCGAVVR